MYGTVYATPTSEVSRVKIPESGDLRVRGKKRLKTLTAVGPRGIDFTTSHILLDKYYNKLIVITYAANVVLL